MADREFFIEGVQFLETGEEEFFLEGVQINEDQPDAVGGTILLQLMQHAS